MTQMFYIIYLFSIKRYGSTNFQFYSERKYSSIGSIIYFFIYHKAYLNHIQRIQSYDTNNKFSIMKFRCFNAVMN